MSTKAYVLDTNILLESPKAIFGFDDNIVLITSTTLQELDSKKNKPGELGYNARECCRILEKLREENDNLLNGISINRKGDRYGILKILTCFTKHSLLPDGYSLDIPDNKIINTILKYESDIIDDSYRLRRDVVLNKRFLTKADETPSKIVLVTNDISMRINASVCGLDVQSYHNDEIRVEKEYLGRSLLEVNEGEFNELLTNDFIEYYSENEPLEENEFIEVKCGNRKETAIHKDGLIKKIDIKNVFNVTPKNIAQKFALYALSAPVDEIPIVILKGSAGSAKTFLSLAAGLDATYNQNKENTYDKLLITRNNSQIHGEEFGYLPGSIEEKMMPLLSPFMDNIESLLRNSCINESNEQIQIQIDDMFNSGVVDVCPVAYMRGRSITHSYLIVDECQNATRSQMRDIITRIGSGTKLVLCGDPEQIDNHLLDKWNNGLTFASERMKGSPLCAQITFTEKECVRSDLAKDALKRLNL